MSIFAITLTAVLVGQFGSGNLTNESVDSIGDGHENGNGPAVERPYHEIDNDIRDAMREEAIAETAAEKSAAVERLCELHWELIGDSRLVASPTLKEYRGKVYRRLVRVKTKLEQQIARDARSRSKEEKAQLEELAATSQSLMESMSTVAATSGGPATIIAGTQEGNFGGGAITAQADHGQILVDLIVKTISPDHWEENGGPGAIFYYANLHALVVSATDEVHGRLGGVLDGLRRAGGN